jgi:iron-sulfur cluster repair protein YtfE (RIC family)
MSQQESTPLDAMSVNEILRFHPEAVELFNRYGIDACCGGAAPPREAAVRDGADPDALMRELRAMVAP